MGSLLVGIPDGNKLRYVGRVGSGFSMRELEELRQKVDDLARKTSPFDDVPREDASDAHWVTPRLVGEVTFGQWTGQREAPASGVAGLAAGQDASRRGGRPCPGPLV